MKELGLDPKDYTFAHSDGKTVTLKHKKGHEVTIALNVLSPKNRTILETVAAAHKRMAEPDKMAEGGDINQTKMVPTNGIDATRSEPGYTKMADGGDVLESGENSRGVSTQGHDIRYAQKHKNRGDMERHQEGMDYAKEEARGRRELEKHTKPNLKGLAEGGDPEADQPTIKPQNISRPDNGFGAIILKEAEGGKVQKIPVHIIIAEDHFDDGGTVSDAQKWFSGSFGDYQEDPQPSPSPTPETQKKAKGGRIKDIDKVMEERQEFAHGMRDDSHMAARKKLVPKDCPNTVGGATPFADGGFASYAKHRDMEQLEHEQGLSFSGLGATGVSSPAEAGLPCLNPHCKSHGKPHPNCRCYSGGESFAEGGEVIHYCRRGMKHKPDCEYYAEGGETKKDFWESEHGRQAIDAANKEVDNIRERSKNVDQGRVNPKSQIRTQNIISGENPDKIFLREHSRKKYADGAGPVSQDDDDINYQNSGQVGGAEDLPDDTTPEDTTSDSQNTASQMSPQQIAQLQNDNNSATPPVDYEQELNKVLGSSGVPNMPNAPIPALKQAKETPDASLPPQYTGVAPVPDRQAVPQNGETQQQANIREALQEQGHFVNDLQNGHITPETYHQWYANQSTPSKVATIFGLLLGGFSTQAGHVNPVMNMIDNEINRDMKGQEQSKINAHNLLQLSYQHELNKAQENQMDVNNANVQQDIWNKAYLNRQMRMNAMVFNDLSNYVNKIPPNTIQGQNARQALTMVGQHFDAKNASAASLYNLAQAINTSGTPGVGPGQTPALNQNQDAAFAARQKALRLGGQKDLADFEDKRYVPNVGNFSQEVDPRTRQEMFGHQKLSAGLNNLYSMIDKYATLNHYSPQYIKGTEEVKKLQSDLRDGVLGTVYRESEQPLLDQLLEMPPAKVLDYQTKAQLQQLSAINNRDFDVLKKSHGYTGGAPNKIIPGVTHRLQTFNGKQYYVPIK